MLLKASQEMAAPVIFLHYPGQMTSLNLAISPALLLELLAVAVAYVLFRTIIKPYFLPSPFVAIPGPKPQSWAMGAFCSHGSWSKLIAATGNLGQLFNAKGIPFHKSLPDKYGGIVKVHGFFGVGTNIKARAIKLVN
jgi:hypothetical protein